MTGALSVDAALEHLLSAIKPLPPIELPLLEAHGCVLAADVFAEADVPPFSVSAIDGFAVRAADLHEASPETPVRLSLVGWSRLGRPPAVAVAWGQATGIESGAALPQGADTVVGSGVLEGEAVVVASPAEPGAGLLEAGSVLGAGEVLVPEGRRLSGPEIGMLAAAGRATVPAHAQVRVAVLAAGELAEPGRPATFGQQQDAVSHALVAAVRDAGAIAHRVGIVRGGEEEVREALVSNLARADALVCAGEVFAGGGHDLVTSGLGEVAPLDIAMSPGGHLDVGSLEGKPYFGVPLDPASALVSFEVLVRPALLRLMGREEVGRPVVRASLDGPVKASAETVFLPVRVGRSGDGWTAEALEGSLLSSLVRANGLAEVTPGQGDEVAIRLLRSGPR